MRVLVITDDNGPLLHGRVNLPLRQLRQQGLIESFAVCDTRLHGDAGDGCEFDALLLQRTGAIPLLNLLADNGIPYCLDLDDNLILLPSYRMGTVPQLGLEAAINGCKVLSSPSRRLAAIVEKYTCAGLQGKLKLTPNSLEFPPSVRPARKPSQILRVQHDAAALGYSAEEIRSAVDDFARNNGLEICLIGDSMKAEKLQAKTRRLPSMPYEDLLRYLHEGPPSIGVAPLETVADEATLDFISSKSDVKKLLFGGFGHPGVYSLALPYVESDLVTGILARNTYQGWIEALGQCYELAWQRSAAEAERIREVRSASRVARLSWLPAIEGARSPGPVGLGWLRAELGKSQSDAGGAASLLPREKGTQMERIKLAASDTVTNQRVHALEMQVRMLTQALGQIKQDVDGIYQSATWRTLIKLGCIVRRFLPFLGARKP